MTEYTIEQILEWDKWNNVLVREHEPKDDSFHFRTDKDPSFYSWTGFPDCGMPATTILYNKPTMVMEY